MQYTFGQACKQLGASAHAYGASDIKLSINRAIQALASMTGWECLRKVLRFSSAGPCFTLPQGYAGLVRVCVNGRPTTIRGQDFRFIQSGPGDLRTPPPGFSPVRVSNIYDAGRSPTYLEPPGLFRLFAYADAPGQPALSVTGIAPDGKIVTAAVPMNTYPVYDGGTLVSGTAVDSAAPTGTVFNNLTSVALDECATAYVTLYAVDEANGQRYPISLYHPEVKAPTFRKYELPDVRPGQPVELLVEARIDPLPLVNPTDIVPFDCLEPIEWMIRADWCMKSGELTSAQRYHERAAQWLKAQEIANDTVQTQVVINTVVAGSPGEVSMDAFNI